MRTHCCSRIRPPRARSSHSCTGSWRWTGGGIADARRRRAEQRSVALGGHVVELKDAKAVELTAYHTLPMASRASLLTASIGEA